STLATAALLLFSLRARTPLRDLGAGLVLGGWAGNALDRRQRGRVTDFLDLGAGPLRWPAFNLADAAIVSGAALLARAISTDCARPHGGALHRGDSNQVWDKRAALNRAEIERVRLHPLLGERMLAFSPLLAPLGAIAAQHMSASTAPAIRLNSSARPSLRPA